MFGFAALQWNDQDRLLWISVYVAGALLAILIFTKKCKACASAWAIMLSVICLIMMIKAFPGLIEYVKSSSYNELYSAMTEEKPYIEQVREFLGLLIVLCYCLISAYILFKNRRD